MRIVEFIARQISLFKLKNENAWLSISIFGCKCSRMVREHFFFAVIYNIILIMSLTAHFTAVFYFYP